MGIWRNETRQGAVVSASAKLGRLKISVHHHIYHPPEQWLVSAPPFLDCKTLPSDTLDDAKKMAVEALKSELDVVVSALESL